MVVFFCHENSVQLKVFEQLKHGLFRVKAVTIDNKVQEGVLLTNLGKNSFGGVYFTILFGRAIFVTQFGRKPNAPATFSAEK